MEIAFDIETIPNRDLILCMPEPEIKYGNTKDEEKRKVIEQEAKSSQVSKMALDPFYGRICSYAVFGSEINKYHTIDEISDAAEIELISEIFDLFSNTSTSYPRIITWNGISFDMRFLFIRAAILRVVVPAGCVRYTHVSRKYVTEPHVDLMQVLCGWNGRMHLDEAAKMFLGKSKTEHDFSKFIELIESGKSNEIGLYNLNDAEITFQLYTVLKPYLL